MRLESCKDCIEVKDTQFPFCNYHQGVKQVIKDVLKIIDKYFPPKNYKKYGVIGLTLSQKLSFKEEVEKLK